MGLSPMRADMDRELHGHVSGARPRHGPSLRQHWPQTVRVPRTLASLPDRAGDAGGGRGRRPHTGLRRASSSGGVEEWRSGGCGMLINRCRRVVVFSRYVQRKDWGQEARERQWRQSEYQHPPDTAEVKGWEQRQPEGGGVHSTHRPTAKARHPKQQPPDAAAGNRCFTFITVRHRSLPI